MTKLTTFTTIAEKSRVFNRVSPKSFEELIETLSQLEEKNAFFRGIPDAERKLYTSSQREWITNDLQEIFGTYNNYESKKLEYIKTNQSARLLGCCKVINDISIYSSLQHYGCSTPLLDFSSKFDIALHFATCEEISFGSNETNSYISVYVIFEGGAPTTPLNDMTSFSKVVEDARMDLDALKQQHGYISGLDYTDVLKYSLWSRYSTVMMKESDEWYMRIANPRSELQRGLFVALNNPDKSLDDLCNNNAEEMTEGFTEELALPKLTCIDIHKSLRPKILEYLACKKISNASLGLDGNDWGKVANRDFLSKH